jgi:diadenosine tetraphosphatase ApaH/serine/threonine PP2A family protein phosphatase
MRGKTGSFERSTIIGATPGCWRWKQAPNDLIWGGGTFPDGYDGEDIVVYGHRNNATLDADGWPRPTTNGRTIGIDTISHGVLTAIRLPDRKLFQSAR